MTHDERTQLDILAAKVDAVEAKIDQLLIYHEYGEASRKDHELRIRSIEKWKLSIPVSILVVIVTLVSGLLARI